jgi:Na+/proline symporter
VLAIGTRRATGLGAFVGLIGGMATVALVAFSPATRSVSFLWHNVVGVVAVVIVGMTVSLLSARRATQT